MRKRLICLCVFLTALLIVPAAFGQAAAPPPWSAGGIDFSALIDGYYSFNFAHPSSGFNAGIPQGGITSLYNFNQKADTFALNMAKVTLSHSADPVGFQLDLGFGRAFDIVNASEPFLGTNNIEQAFVSYKPSKDKGFQFDFGKFVTWAGAEVIETQSNWNYSRSLLFSWAIPYYHFGIRATDTVGKFTVGAQLVNGWNNTEDNNRGKTVGLMANYAAKKWGWNNTYYVGPENPGTNVGWRSLYDTTFTFTPTGKLSAYANFDYGRDRGANCNSLGSVCSVGALSEWLGVAGAARYQVTANSAFAGRWEDFRDYNGHQFNVICFNNGAGGDCQSVQEVTFTYEYKWTKGLLSRLEYRRDWIGDNARVFENKLVNSRPLDHSDTLTLGFVAFVGPK